MIGQDSHDWTATTRTAGNDRSDPASAWRCQRSVRILCVGSEFLVNTFTESAQTQPRVAINSSGEFVIAWQSDNQDVSGLGVYLQRFDSSGNAVGAETTIQTTTSGDQQAVDVALDNTGRLVAAWDGIITGDTKGIAQQQYALPTLTSTAGDGSFDTTMTLQASVTDLNAILDGLTYAPNASYLGSDTLTITTDDLGNTGSPGALQDIDTVDINVFDPTPQLDLDADDSSGAVLADFVNSFTEDGGPVSLTDADASIADLDGTDLDSLIVTITNHLDGVSEVLSADTTGTSINASYDSATGVLTLSNTDTLANRCIMLQPTAFEVGFQFVQDLELPCTDGRPSATEFDG